MSYRPSMVLDIPLTPTRLAEEHELGLASRLRTYLKGWDSPDGENCKGRASSSRQPVSAAAKMKLFRRRLFRPMFPGELPLCRWVRDRLNIHETFSRFLAKRTANVQRLFRDGLSHRKGAGSLVKVDGL